MNKGRLVILAVPSCAGKSLLAKAFNAFAALLKGDVLVGIEHWEDGLI